MGNSNETNSIYLFYCCLTLCLFTRWNLREEQRSYVNDPTSEIVGSRRPNDQKSFTTVLYSKNKVLNKIKRKILLYSFLESKRFKIYELKCVY